MCEYHVWIFLLICLCCVSQKASILCLLLSLDVCLCSMILDFISYKLGINKPCMVKSCRLRSTPIIMSTNHVKFVVFCLLLSWHFFLWYFFHGIYLMYIIHTPCLKCWWYVCHVQKTWCLCRKFMQSLDLPFSEWFG